MRRRKFITLFGGGWMGPRQELVEATDSCHMRIRTD
jgi:hypothetical protein